MAVKPGNRTTVPELKVFPDETDVQAVPPWLGNPNIKNYLEGISFFVIIHKGIQRVQYSHFILVEQKKLVDTGINYLSFTKKQIMQCPISKHTTEADIELSFSRWKRIYSVGSPLTNGYGFCWS